MEAASLLFHFIISSIQLLQGSAERERARLAAGCLLLLGSAEGSEKVLRLEKPCGVKINIIQFLL